MDERSSGQAEANTRCRDLEFFVDDIVSVRVSPLKNVIRFGSNGKFPPRFKGPLPI